MQITVSPQSQSMIEKRLNGGQYASAAEIVEVALQALEREEEFGEFAPGELSQLVEEGRQDRRPPLRLAGRQIDRVLIAQRRLQQ